MSPPKSCNFLEVWVWDFVIHPHNQYIVLTVDFESPELELNLSEASGSHSSTADDGYERIISLGEV